MSIEFLWALLCVAVISALLITMLIVSVLVIHLWWMMERRKD